ncbi:MAG: hypothetical protein JSW28_10465 [Thermoplasmata archaeon]|nr:MAG: hypothetical protein JSW28_10465 [Thermoplasmata archaeon]
MTRRERKWTKRKLLVEPESHPILALWSEQKVVKVLKKRGESGLHFNDLRYLLCKDFRDIKRPPKGWGGFSSGDLDRMREYNDYTILQKDLTKLCDMGLLNKEARGYYTPMERPVMRYIQDITFSGKSLISSTAQCDIVATETFELPEDVELECDALFLQLMDARANAYRDEILDFWKDADASKLDLPQKIVLKSELYSLARSEELRRLIKKSCLVTSDKGKEPFDISPFRRRNAEKMRTFIVNSEKYAKQLGPHTVKFALGMYTYPKIFTEKYIKGKGTAFREELAPYMERLKGLQMEMGKPCYVLFAPKR